MKICFISNLYPPNILGGAEISVNKVAEELVKRKHEVVVITTSDDKNAVENLNGVKVYRINPLNLYKMYHHQGKNPLIKPIWHVIDLWNIHSNWLIKNILKKENPDIVHIHNFKGLSLSSFKTVKDLNLPLVFTAHDYSLICMRANLINSSGNICQKPNKLCAIYNEIQNNIVEGEPDLILSPSQFVIDKIKANGLFKHVKACKLPLGIELDINENLKDYKNIEILYTGNLGEHKGVHILIEAFKRIKNNKIHLNIVGKGTCADKLRTMAQEDERIIFHGFLQGEELLNMYKRANLTIVPSIWYDNSPMVIYESFMCGTPVIGSDIGGIPELIENGYNGFLFKPGNINELQKLIENLIDNPKKLKDLENGASESVKKYSMENHINKLVKLYQTTITETTR